jgi:hypothetical protein
MGQSHWQSHYRYGDAIRCIPRAVGGSPGGRTTGTEGAQEGDRCVGAVWTPQFFVGSIAKARDFALLNASQLEQSAASEFEDINAAY